MTGDRNNILVAARVKPLLSTKEGGHAVVHACQEEHGGTIYIERSGNSKQYNFDYVFGSEAEQKDIFIIVKPLVECILDGYNSTVFAYGQTGSGKTFTMGTDALSLAETGSSEVCTEITARPGVVYRATDYLFSMMAERRSVALANGQPVPEFTVSAIFVEIYNDDVVDLLAEKKQSIATGKKLVAPKQNQKPAVKKAFVRNNENGEVVLDNVTTVTCETAASVLTCLQDGSLARRTATTAYNERSSRSHAIFTIVCNQHRLSKSSKTVSKDPHSEPHGDDLADEVLVAKMHFVDLAGSERLHDAIISTGQAAQERFREGVNINMGLLTLGKVISMLSDGKTSQYIPYRESKLTRLLQDSLGGNSRTLMIACVSGADCYAEQSMNTLQYATNARKIKNQAVVNRTFSVAQLRAENNSLRKKLDTIRNSKTDPETLTELNRLRQENQELNSKISYYAEELDRIEQEKSNRCVAETQTEPLSSLTDQEAFLLAMKAVKSPCIGDATLTDNLISSSFQSIYKRIVSDQAEMIALKEELEAPTSSSNSRIFSDISDMTKLREIRRKRKMETTVNRNGSIASSISQSCEEETTTPIVSSKPETTETTPAWSAVSAASTIENDGDDESRDPTYEPTPLRINPTSKGRKKFEYTQDGNGNRRLTRAADQKLENDLNFSLPKKSKLVSQTSTKESDSENIREFCKCHGFCKSRCSCRKNGMSCYHEANDIGCGCDTNLCMNKEDREADERSTTLRETSLSKESSRRRKEIAN